MLAETSTVAGSSADVAVSEHGSAADVTAEREKTRELANATQMHADTVVHLSQPFLFRGCRQQNGWQPNLGNTVRIELPEAIHDSFGAQFTVHARPTDTIDSVKARVSALLGVPAAQLRLIYGGRALPQPNPAPRALPPAPEQGIEVTVRPDDSVPAAQQLTVTIAKGCTVASLKATVEAALGVRAVLQTLASDGKQLSDTSLGRLCGVYASFVVDVFAEAAISGA